MIRYVRLEIKCMESRIIMLPTSFPKQALKSMGDSFTSSSFLPILLMTGSETKLENRAVEMGPSSLPVHQGISPLFLRRRESAGHRDGLEGIYSIVDILLQRQETSLPEDGSIRLQQTQKAA
ncbi:hypothetical protein WA556_005530 [Blastocystis sp. ATCC 50177/Nand II]